MSTGLGRTAPHPAARGPARTTTPGLVLASRGDALTPYLFEAVARRYRVTGHLDPELSRPQRAVVAAASFRPSRVRWAEQFHKSGLGYTLRSVNAARGRRDVGPAPVLQVHALFEVRGADTLLYVDCTHRQSAEHWPAWNPLRGRALRRWYDRETAAYLGARHVFAFSRATERSLVDAYGVDPERVSVVGAGINSRALSDTEPRTPPPASRPPTVLMIGNDFARKGGHVLLEAFSRVRRDVPEARLRLVGTRPPIGTPPPGVEVLGRIHDRARVLDLYQEADVFCLPSFFDPLPLVLLEAMSEGVPVVTSDSCGIPDLLTHDRDGVLVPAGDPTALAGQLVRLLRDPTTAARLGTAGRARVRDSFTWDHVVERMAPVLDVVVGPR